MCISGISCKQRDYNNDSGVKTSLMHPETEVKEGENCHKVSVAQAKEFLKFHFGEADDRMVIYDDKVKNVPSFKNPANSKQMLDVVEVWASIYKADYRMRFIYGTAGSDKCVLLGQEILDITDAAAPASANMNETCAKEAYQRGSKLLTYHFGSSDDRMIIQPISGISDYTHPTSKKNLKAIGVDATIYKGSYSMKFIYGGSGKTTDDCILLGEEILENVSL